MIPTSSLRIKKIKFGTQRRQYYLKVTGPESKSEKVVIYLHGGGWLFGTPEGFVQNAMVFTKKGYTVYMPSYRRLPVYDFQDMYNDLKNACHKIKNTRHNNINELIISGMSAGAHLGAILALDKNLDWEKMLNSVRPKSYIGIGSPLDLTKMWQSPVIKFLTRKDYTTANPISYLHSDAPSMLSISAGRDGIVYHQAQQSFEFAANTMNLQIETHHEPESTHMQIAEWSIPGNKTWKVVNNFLNYSSNKAVNSGTP